MKHFMKSFRSLSYSILIISTLFFAGCGPAATENKNNTSASIVSPISIAGEKYVIDKKESVVTWKGSMVVAGKGQHIGYAYLSAGELMIEKGQLAGGAVEVDMNTLTLDPVHPDRGSDNNLISHLKSSDFFDVEKFPTSTFVITVVPPVSGENINVTGNLTMKGITHTVTFPATIEVKDGVVTANGKLIVDRTKWDVRYKSGKFFDILADEVISDDIEFDLKIVAKKSSSVKIIKTAVKTTITNDVKPVATNIVFQSNDGGQTWQDISQGLPGDIQPEGFFAGESDLYLHAKNMMYRSTSNLKIPVWEKVNVHDSQSASIVFNRSIVNVAESEGVLIATGQKGIMRSTDNGEHWQWVIREGGVGIAVECINGGFAVISYSAKTKTRRIRISLDRGETWQAIDEGFHSSSISSIKQIGNYLICGHPDGIFRSSDMGKTWNLVHPGFNKNKNSVFAIYTSGNTVYAVEGSGGC